MRFLDIKTMKNNIWIIAFRVPKKKGFCPICQNQLCWPKDGFRIQLCSEFDKESNSVSALVLM
jgi:hypothetical protein